MPTLFTSHFFANNRRALRKALASDIPVVIAANGLQQKSGDNTYPFHQDSNFWYLTGINEPDLLLVIDGNREYLIVPGRSTSREAFDGAVDADTLVKRSGIQAVLNEEDGWQQLGVRIQHTKQVHALHAPPGYIEQYGMYTNPARARLITRLKEQQRDIEIRDIRAELTRLRMIKQPEELQAIQKAIDVTIGGIQNVLQRGIDAFRYEFEIENELTRAFRTNQASGHAFAPIVASGKRAVTLHNIDNNGELRPQECLVIDVGAEVERYAADITRTVVFGKPSRRQQAVYDAVLAVQNFAMDLLKPGTILKEYETAVEKFMGEKLRELDLITDINRESVRRYYPHATSHFIGLDVHDVGDYAQPLAPGMVLTCEPGIYIPQEGIGVRIEDDVLISDSGSTILSAELSKRLSA